MLAFRLYKKLYTAKKYTTYLPIMDHQFSTLFDSLRFSLEMNFMPDEVKGALFSMDPFKAPGSDGFHASFFQKSWSVVQDSLSNMVLAVLRGSALPSSVGEILIMLIPKVSVLESLNQFRPISLCNVVFKVITKVLVNRIKLVLPSLVASTQSTFIPG